MISDERDLPASVIGKRTRLRPVLTSDYEFIYRLSLGGDAIWRWRYRGATPSPQLFQSTLWEGVLAQFLVEDLNGQPAGLVSIYNADMVGGHAYVAVLIGQKHIGKTWPLEAVLLLLDYAFKTWPFRKLYFEFSSSNADPFAETARRHLREEGRLVGHDYAQGGFVDRVICSLSREKWLSALKWGM